MGNFVIPTTPPSSTVPAGGAAGQILAKINDFNFNTQWINSPSLTGFVPYIGATQAVNLGAYDLTVNSIKIGRGNGSISTNTIIGELSLSVNTTGYLNTAVGNSALQNNTTGYNNAAFGALTLFSNTTGFYNLAIGTETLYLNTSGNKNVAFGHATLYKNTTGNQNLGLGHATLFNNTEGYQNTANGPGSLFNNTLGVGNVGIGYQGLFGNTTGNFNIGVGYNTGRFASDGTTPITSNTQCIYIGYLTKSLDNAQINEIVIGNNAIGLGSNTIVLGDSLIITTALKGNVGIGTTTPAYPLVIGTNVGGIGSDFSVQTSGTAAKLTLSSQSATTSFGANPQSYYANGVPPGASFGSTAAGYRTTVGCLLTAAGGGTYVNFSTNGASSGFHITHNFGADLVTVLSNGNFGIGTTTPAYKLDINGNTNITGTLTTSKDILVNGIIIGRGVGDYDTNVVIGNNSFKVNTLGVSNVSIGFETLVANTTGYFNVAIGKSSLYSNTSGYNNTSIGATSLYSNTIGYSNTAIGNFALGFNVSGYNNTAIGDSALSNTTGNNNLGIGQNCNLLNNSDNNSIVIGKDAVGIGSNTVVIGNNDVVTTALKGSVGIGTVSPAVTAILDVASTTKGFLPPRMTTLQKIGITLPAIGLVIYDTDLNKLCVFTSVWETVTSV